MKRVSLYSKEPTRERMERIARNLREITGRTCYVELETCSYDHEEVGNITVRYRVALVCDIFPVVSHYCNNWHEVLTLYQSYKTGERRPNG